MPRQIPAFQIDKTSIDDVAKTLGSLYKQVTIAKDPMYAWVQIVNDVTILGEDLRRGRHTEGAGRACKVLFRLLEFVGYYLHEHPVRPKSRQHTFADFLAHDLRRTSSTRVFSNGPPEGPTRWILAKYPRVCSKCAKQPCECLLKPWVFENRREDPGPYQEYREAADAARRRLAENPGKPLTLLGMLDMFVDIYQNSYYREQPAHLGMHLTEELGEATIELSRLLMAFRAKPSQFRMTKPLIREVFEDAREKIDKEIAHLKKRHVKRHLIDERQASLHRALDSERRAFQESDGWEVFRQYVSEKLKEETSDVFSWLAAVLHKLDPKQRQVREQRKRFIEQAGDGPEYLRCAWCHDNTCRNQCLVTHSISKEIIEKITKF